MVNLRNLGEKAKALIDKRGGTEALKDDAAELKDIATGQGSVTDKAKRAAEALKDPGAKGGAGEPQGPDAEAAGTSAAERKGAGHDGGRRKRRAEGRRGPRDAA